MLKKVKSERKKKKRFFTKIKQLENDLVKVKCAKNPNKLESELKELSKIQVVSKILHYNNNEILRDR